MFLNGGLALLAPVQAVWPILPADLKPTRGAPRIAGRRSWPVGGPDKAGLRLRSSSGFLTKAAKSAMAEQAGFGRSRLVEGPQKLLR